MKLYKVYNTNTGKCVGESCLQAVGGDYVGVNTGCVYDRDGHYCKPIYPAVIISVDQENKTGISQLDAYNIFGVNKKEWKERYIGCEVTVSVAHSYNDVTIYWCHELKEFFSQFELSADKYE